MLVLGKVPDGTTVDQVIALLMSDEGAATPTPGTLSDTDIVDFGGVFMQSKGQTVWPMLDLPAGTFVAACFVPDPRNGMPHAMEGMINLFQVTA